ncbi:heavy metal translocating P-type ATPase [Thiomicrospira pelophila]|uniref:heavy metal translocating P-type ATPase n=1 Tax=Thiomicrospira pelophila TaxID=934 RepID=UPI0004A71928|nr:heavy metal translocating P-type ATPase [Thiomicrospira pelophila]
MSQCYHCGQEITQNERVDKVIKGHDRSFCCHGCASVCEVIHSSGLESFYKLSPDTQRPVAPKQLSQASDFFDYDEVQSQFVKNLGQVRQITLMSDAIHCAACIWLIEHSLAKIDGILYANVNFTNKQIKVRWDNSKIQLSEILQRLNQIGYDARPYDAEESEQAYRKANRDLLYRLGFAGFAVMNAMWFSVALYTGANDDAEYRSYFYFVLFLLASATLVYSAQPFLKGAFQSLKAKTVGMDVSISLGLLITYGYSTWVMLQPDHVGQAFFATVIDLTFLLLIGRYLEAISKNKALDSTRRLMELQPKMARQYINGVEQVVPVRLLKAGDRVWVKPGDKIPVDGQVVEGESQVNESMLSGESREVFKQIGHNVSAGTINLDGSLAISVEATLDNTRLARIIHLVEDAQGSKATIQCTAEKIMPWFVSATLTLATLAFMFWWWKADVETAIMAGTAVLIITCPCALGLATPMAMAVAAGVSARNGILVKNSVVLEMLNEVDHFVFDKTGTLTKGQMSWVDESWAPGLVVEEWLTKIAKIEQKSEHSLARAIVKSMDSRQPDWQVNKLMIDEFKAEPGRGVSAKINQDQVRIGTGIWLKQFNINLPDEMLTAEQEQAKLGRSSVWVANNQNVIGVLFIEDELREDAKALIERLQARGKQVTLLSGDRQQVANAVAHQLGGMNVMAEVLPEDKSQVIADLQKQGQKVAMVGDGINDAPALSRANVGFALGGGTDVSMDSADIILLNNELLSINTSLALSDRTLKTVKQNIGLSITYNIIMVPLAMAAMLTPLIASITMPLSSLAVILNAMRIRGFFKKPISRKVTRG